MATLEKSLQLLQTPAKGSDSSSKTSLPGFSGFSFESLSTDSKSGVAKSGDDSEKKADDAKKTGKPAINFDLSKGLSFNTSSGSKSSKGQSKPITTSFGFSSGGQSLLPSNSEYDSFLRGKIAKGQTLSKSLTATDSNPPNLASRKNVGFVVREVPVSGVHFDQIFKYDEDPNEDDTELGRVFIPKYTENLKSSTNSV